MCEILAYVKIGLAPQKGVCIEQASQKCLRRSPCCNFTTLHPPPGDGTSGPLAQYHIHVIILIYRARFGGLHPPPVGRWHRQRTALAVLPATWVPLALRKGGHARGCCPWLCHGLHSGPAPAAAPASERWSDAGAQWRSAGPEAGSYISCSCRQPQTGILEHSGLRDTKPKGL